MGSSRPSDLNKEPTPEEFLAKNVTAGVSTAAILGGLCGAAIGLAFGGGRGIAHRLAKAGLYSATLAPTAAANSITYEAYLTSRKLTEEKNDPYSTEDDKKAVTRKRAAFKNVTGNAPVMTYPCAALGIGIGALASMRINPTALSPSLFFTIGGSALTTTTVFGASVYYNTRKFEQQRSLSPVKIR